MAVARQFPERSLSGPTSFFSSLSRPHPMRPFLVFPVFALSLASAFSSVVCSQVNGPELHALPQLGCKIGQSIPPVASAVGQSLTEAVYDLSDYGFHSDLIPADAEPGIYQVRVIGQNGLSNSRNFLVTAEPWSVVSGNESEVNPALISPGTIWQDECPDRGRNYYRLKVDQDQKLVLQTFAYSLDSRARLVISLLNADHATVATSSATNDCDADLGLDLKANIEYTLVVHDHLYRGGTDYRYAMKLATSATPSFAESSLIERWKRQSNRQPSGSNQPLLLSSPWNPRACMLRPPSDAPSVLHDESQFPIKKTLTVQWPCIVLGQWNSNDDVDIIDFECEAKTDVSIEVVSQRLGEWTDGLLVVYRVENVGQPNELLHRIVENDDGPPIGNGELRFAIKDPMLTFQTTEKGTYRLHVRSQQRLDRSKAQPEYAIEIRRPNPGFVLSANFSHPTIAAEQARIVPPTLCAGGSAMITVHAMRFDNFADPIELNLTGLPDGVRGGSGVMAKEQSQATLNLWSVGPPPVQDNRPKPKRIEVVGTVEIGPQSLAHHATPLEVTWNLIDTYRSPIAKVMQSLIATKLDSTTCPLTIELGAKELDAKSPIRMDVIRGQSLKIPVRVSRRTGGEAVITVRLHHGPPKATLAEIKIEPKSIEAVLELVVPKDAPTGEFMLGTLCESVVTVPNSDPSAKEKTKSVTLQLPSSNLRVRIGDAQ